MTLLAPLGLLALISLIILLIIYIIRPNFQQRVISSTYIWKLSLKYKKKRVPVSKLRNLLLIICQVLILVCCALVLSQPNKILMAKESGEEAIIIIDASASMRIETQNDDGSRESRFERAVTDAIDLADYTFRNEGKVSVIIADDSPEFLIANRLTYTSANSLYAALRALLDDEYACSYGTGDIDKALSLCEDIILVNDSTQVFLYTDIQYPNIPKGVTVENMAYEDDWNLSILNAYTVYEDNYYNFYVEVACYGQNFEGLNLKLEVRGYNDTPDIYTRMADSSKLNLIDGTVYTVAFRHSALSDGIVPPETMIIQDLGQDIYLFNSVYVSIVDGDNKITSQIFSEDGLFEDNEFYIYGGQKTPLKVEYVSSYPNPFVNGAILALRSYYAGDWDITITSTKFIEDAVFEGYDLYIFEHDEMPTSLPVDGVTLIISPENQVTNGTGVSLGNVKNVSTGVTVFPSKDADHPLLNNINPENFYVGRYTQVASYDESKYTCLLSIVGSPLLLVANDSQNKVVYFNMDLHYSNLPLQSDWPLFMYNLFEYFFPAMIDANSFEVNEEFTLRARGESITVKGGDYVQTYTEFPAKASITVPGTYTVSQDTFSISSSGNTTITESIYVRLPASESDAHFEADAAPLNPYSQSDVKDFYEDLLLYVAIALTALMFAEWLLQIRDNM